MLAVGFSNPLDIQGSFTLAELMAIDPTANTRRRAWCTDLFGGPGDWCFSDGVTWKPVRPFSVRTMTVTGDMSVSAMVQPPTLILAGAIGVGVNRAVTLGSANAYVGAVFRVVRRATGLGGLLVNGLGIPLNGWSDHEWDGSAWVQTASGGLL